LRGQVASLAASLGMSTEIMSAYADICKQPYGYLLVDLMATQRDELRLRTNLMPEDKYQICYVKKL
jgi:hypothetical protein